MVFVLLYQGYAIRRVVKDYPFSPHLLHALLCGRLVVVLATEKYEKEVRTIVNALTMFVPGHHR